MIWVVTHLKDIFLNWKRKKYLWKIIVFWKYEAIPIFWAGITTSSTKSDSCEPHVEKTMRMISWKAMHYEVHEVIQNHGSVRELRPNTRMPTMFFSPRQISYAELAELCDVVFIALHGRPGEDGEVATSSWICWFCPTWLVLTLQSYHQQIQKQTKFYNFYGFSICKTCFW